MVIQQPVIEMNSVMRGFGDADNAIQGLIRKRILQLPDEGALPAEARFGGAREFLGRAVHHSAPGYGKEGNVYRAKDSREGRMGIGVGRGIQAVGITAAGASLMKLADAFNEHNSQPIGGPETY